MDVGEVIVSMYSYVKCSYQHPSHDVHSVTAGYYVQGFAAVCYMDEERNSRWEESTTMERG